MVFFQFILGKCKIHNPNMVKSIKLFVSSLKTEPNYHLLTRIKFEKMSIKVLTIAFSLCLSGKKVSYTVDRRQRKVNPHKTDRIIDRKYLPPCDIYLECVYVVYKWRAEGEGAVRGGWWPA